MENKLLNIIKYPIKLLLKKKVDRYRAELVSFKQRQVHIVPKSRRTGMTNTLVKQHISLMGRMIKCRNFINRWEIN